MNVALLYHEWRISIRKWNTWIFALLIWILSLLVVLTSGDAIEYVYWYTTLIQAISNIIFFQFPLMIMLLTPMLLRHKNQSADWFWILPTHSLSMFANQLLVTLFIILATHCLSLLIVFVGLYVQGVIVFSNLISFYFYGLLLLLPTTLLQIGMIALISLVSQRLIATILIVMTLNILTWMGIILPHATILSPLNYTWLTLNMNPVSGLGPERPLVIWLVGCYSLVGFASLLIGLAVNSQRDYRGRAAPATQMRMVGALAGCGLIVAIMGGWYQAAVAKARVPASWTQQVDVWDVQRASHAGRVEQTILSISATLELTNRTATQQNEIILNLNTGLDIQAVHINHQPTPFEQRGESVNIFTGQGIEPQGYAIVQIKYSGSLRLLREDYARVQTIGGERPPSYAKPVLNYHDQSLLFLTRDGDWRIWPFNTTPHHAAQSAQIDLNFHQVPLLLNQATSDTEGYHWLSPLPNILVVDGNYQLIARDHYQLYLPTSSTPYDDSYAERVATLYQELQDQVSAVQAEELPVSVVLLPYIDQPLVGGSIIGIPLNDPQAQLERRFLTNDYWQQRGLATSVARAWLNETLKPTIPLTTTGVSFTFQQQCSLPDSNGKQQCTTIYPDIANPQAPFQRLIPVGSNDQAIRALSIVLGQYMVAETTDDWQSLAEEHDQWSDLAINSFASGSRERLVGVGVLPRGGTALPADDVVLAQNIERIIQLRVQRGEQFFAQLMNALTAAIQTTTWNDTVLERVINEL